MLANTLSLLGQEHEESAEAVRIAEGREVALPSFGQHLHQHWRRSEEIELEGTGAD